MCAVLYRAVSSNGIVSRRVDGSYRAILPNRIESCRVEGAPRMTGLACRRSVLIGESVRSSFAPEVASTTPVTTTTTTTTDSRVFEFAAVTTAITTHSTRTIDVVVCSLLVNHYCVPNTSESCRVLNGGYSELVNRY